MLKAATTSPAAKYVAQRASVGVGRLTSGLRMLPTVLIIGGQRCGTTSLYRTLTQHPAVQKAVLHKGVHYFDMDYDKGLSWYRAHFPLQLTAARLQRAVGLPSLVLESSPYYMFHPMAAERVARDLPDARLLVLLRDPVERAYSAHAHELARNYETEPFERALELEPERLRGEAQRLAADAAYRSHVHRHNAYVTRGQYIEQLERVEAVVGRERLHVLDSQDFFDRPDEVYSDVLRFLGLPARGNPVFEQHNSRPRSPMPDSLRRRLDEHFRPFDERLARWWGRTPSWRR